mmetsp:Transcript_14071/g.24882  ORF Transcript_14071/g.24882 Transcript_14071/m.24882 type:complete len:208 (-) Transcript_14071:9-632(-)
MAVTQDTMKQAIRIAVPSIHPFSRPSSSPKTPTNKDTIAATMSTNKVVSLNASMKRRSKPFIGGEGKKFLPNLCSIFSICSSVSPWLRSTPKFAAICCSPPSPFNLCKFSSVICGSFMDARTSRVISPSFALCSSTSLPVTRAEAIGIISRGLAISLDYPLRTSSPSYMEIFSSSVVQKPDCHWFKFFFWWLRGEERGEGIFTVSVL